MNIWQLWVEWLGINRIERFGQFVCNRCNLTNPDIFYEKNNTVAYEKLVSLPLFKD